MDTEIGAGDELPLEQALAIRSFSFDRLSAMAAVLDGTGHIIDTNEAWRLSAHLNDASSDSTGPGVDYLELCDRAVDVGADHAAAVARGLRRILAGEQAHFDIEYLCPTPTQDKWFMLQASAAPVAQGAGIVLLHVDITARRLREDRLIVHADRDELTGLPNRRSAIRLIDDHLVDARRVGTLVTLILLELDGLERVNDEHGHHVGDEVVVQVSARARRAIRDGDLLCRLAGDELVLVCPELDTVEATSIAGRLEEVMARPFQVGAAEISICATVDVTTSSAASVADSLLNDPLEQGMPRRARRPSVRAPRPAAFPSMPNRTSGGATATELAASQAMADAIIAHSNDLVMFFRADGLIEWVSPASERIMGTPAESLMGTKGLDLVHPDDRDRVRAEFRTIPNLGDHVLTEFRVIDPSGEVHWIEESATNLVHEPHVGVIVANLRDITVRKLAQDAVRFQARLLAAAGQPIVAADASGTVIYWNDAAHDAYGWTAEEALGRKLAEVLAPAMGWDETAEHVRSTLRDGQSWSGEYRLRAKGGIEIPVLVTDTPVFDDDGLHVATIAVSSDISERIRNEETAARLSLIVESSSDAIFSESLDGTVTTWNAGATELYGFTEAEMIGRNVSAMAPPDRPHEPFQLLDRMRRGEHVKNLETVRCRNDGSEFHVALTVSPIRDASGSITGASTIARDVTERVELRQRIEEDRRRLADAQASARLGSFEIDLDTGAVIRSAELWRIFGTEPGTIQGLDFDHIHPDDRDMVAAGMSDAIAGAEVECTHRIVRPSGEVRWVVSSTSRFGDDNDRIVAGTVLDITERHEAELALAHLATHDPLTGLPNRTRLTDQLRALLASAADPDHRVAVVFADLDQFKVINDMLGHAVGDLVLRAVAVRLLAAMEPDDILGRFGGDEFVLVRPGVDSFGDARSLAELAEQALVAPVIVDDQEFQLSASIGVALSEASDSAESLFRDADAAMYQAKDDGRAQITVFDGAARVRAHRRRRLETALRHALDHDELHLEFQPVLELDALEVAGFEALLRWDHPELGRITPAEFIPIAESSGMILHIGEWVLRRALGQLAEWRRDPRVDDHLWVAVNVSTRQLGQPNLAAGVAAALRSAEVPAELLHLEITESFLADRVENAITTIIELRELGIRLSIDDFGTGYSSLSYLNRLPIDTLKIDQSFVQSLDNGARDTSIVRAIIALAETLDLDVVAEGIERPGQLQRLRELGCGLGQGFLWSQAVPARAALDWMVERSAR